MTNTCYNTAEVKASFIMQKKSGFYVKIHRKLTLTCGRATSR